MTFTISSLVRQFIIISEKLYHKFRRWWGKGATRGSFCPTFIYANDRVKNQRGISYQHPVDKFFEKKMWKIVGDSGEFTIFAAKFHFSHFEVTKIHAVHW